MSVYAVIQIREIAGFKERQLFVNQKAMDRGCSEKAITSIIDAIESSYMIVPLWGRLSTMSLNH